MATFKQNVVRYNYSFFFKNVVKNYSLLQNCSLLQWRTTITSLLPTLACYQTQDQFVRFGVDHPTLTQRLMYHVTETMNTDQAIFSNFVT